MKHVRKLMALLLALVMVLSLSVTAFAAEGDILTTKGKITVNNTVKDQTYSIYRIFDLESFSDTTPENHEDGAYSYKVNDAWIDFFTAPAAGEEPTNGRKYVEIDGNGYVTWKENADAAAFAAEAIAYATADATKINAIASKNSTADGASVEFTELTLGYYLVDSSLGALCALTTTNPDVTVIEKNAKPTLTKEVQENSTSAWGSSNDAGINDTVNFRATITVQGTAKDYVMHDTMDIGLTFGSVTGVTLNGETVAQEGNYTVHYNIVHHTTTQTGSHTQDIITNHTFDVEFSESFCANLKSGDVIVVSYTATLDEEAASPAFGRNPTTNSAKLEYKDNNEVTHETEWSDTKTYTWKFDIFKYYLNNGTNTPLAGAEFTLSTDVAGENKIELTNIHGVHQELTSIGSENSVQGGQTVGGLVPGGDPVEPDPLADVTYHVAEADSEGKVTAITTTDLGKLVIEGLDSGTYYLTETKAPAGYNRLAGPIKVVISSTGDVELTSTVKYYNHTGDTANPYVDAETGTGTINVENKAGVELPTTGGMGTTVFYVVGSILLVGAAVLLVTKKRMSAAK